MPPSNRSDRQAWMPLGPRRPQSPDPAPASPPIRRSRPSPRQSRSEDAASRFLANEALINRLDEIIRAPWCRVRAVPARVTSRRGSRLDLVQCQAGLDQIANAIANDGHHVTVLRDVELVAHATMAGNHEGAFLPGHNRHRRNRGIDQAIERRDFTLNRAASCDINLR